MHNGSHGRPARRTAAALLLAAVIAAGCGSTAPSPSPSSAAPEASTASGRSPAPVATMATPSVSLSPSPSPSPTPTARVAAVVACRTSQLAIDIAGPGFGAGNVGAWLRFTNTGSKPCRLHGWPTLIGVTAGGDRTSAGETRSVMTFPNIEKAPTVTLQPGDVAYAAFEGSDPSRSQRRSPLDPDSDP